MIPSAPPAESMIPSACAESIILSARSAKQQSTKSCSRKCGNNGGGRGDSGSGKGFDLGRGSDNCRNDSNGDGNVWWEMELCFPFCESESEWGRSDSVNELRLPTFYYVQGRSSHKSSGHNNPVKIFLSPKIPSLSLREEVSELSAPLSTPHSRVELP
jgi:hypothetical protein